MHDSLNWFCTCIVWRYFFYICWSQMFVELFELLLNMYEMCSVGVCSVHRTGKVKSLLCWIWQCTRLLRLEMHVFALRVTSTILVWIWCGSCWIRLQCESVVRTGHGESKSHAKWSVGKNDAIYFLNADTMEYVRGKKYGVLYVQHHWCWSLLVSLWFSSSPEVPHVPYLWALALIHNPTPPPVQSYPAAVQPHPSPCQAVGHVGSSAKSGACLHRGQHTPPSRVLGLWVSCSGVGVSTYFFNLKTNK